MSDLKTTSPSEEFKPNSPSSTSSGAVFFDGQEKRKVVGFIKQKSFLSVAIDDGLLSSSQKEETENQQNQNLI